MFAEISGVAMIKPIGLVHGHYECRSFEQSVPILEELLRSRSCLTVMDT
jgi:hypothetical protein